MDVLVGMSAGNAGQTEFRRVRVNLREVGVRWEDEFEMALAKAFRREVSVFVAGEGRWPEAAELRPRIEARRFLMIEKPGNASP